MNFPMHGRVRRKVIGHVAGIEWILNIAGDEEPLMPFIPRAGDVIIYAKELQKR